MEKEEMLQNEEQKKSEETGVAKIQDFTALPFTLLYIISPFFININPDSYHFNSHPS